MKKNNVNESLALSEFLIPLQFLIKLSGRAYEKYMKNKIYLHALNIRKSNEMIYRLILDKIVFIPEDLQSDCIELLNHFDCWIQQFKEEEQKRNPAMNAEFVFYRIDDQMAYPLLSEQHILELVKKIRKSNK